MILTADSIDRFLSYLDEKGNSPNTTRAYGTDLRKLLQETGDILNLTEFERKAAQALTKWRSTDGPNTTNRRLASFRRYGKWQHVVVLEDYNAPTAAEPEPHPIPEGIPGVHAMIHAADLQHHRALVSFCGLAGLRVMEARLVMPEDLYQTDAGWVLAVHGKGAKERKIPFTDNAYAFVKGAHAAARLSGAPVVNLADSTARATIYRLSLLALGREHPSHDLRATFATAAYRASDGDIDAVRRLLGHATVTQTQVYIGHSAVQMRKAADVS